MKLKRFLTKKWHGIPVAMVSALLLVGMLAGSAFAAAAAFTLPVPSTVTVTTSVELEAYSDAACTIPLTTIAWGNVLRGTEGTQRVHIKYVGAEDGALVTIAPPSLPVGVTFTWTPEEFEGYSMGLFAGEHGEFVLKLAVDTNAPIGLLSFNINFTSDSIPPLP